VAWNQVNVEDIKVARILLVMVLANVICFSPVIIIESIDFFSRGSYLPRQVYLFYTVAATLPSSFKPIIYGVMNRSFKQEYKRLLRLDRVFTVSPVITADQTGFLVTSPGRTRVSPVETNHAEVTETLSQPIKEETSMNGNGLLH